MGGKLDKVFMLLDLSCCITLANGPLESCLALWLCTSPRTFLSSLDLWQLWYSWDKSGMCEGSCCLYLWKFCRSLWLRSPATMTESPKRQENFSNCCPKTSQCRTLCQWTTCKYWLKPWVVFLFPFSFPSLSSPTTRELTQFCPFWRCYRLFL